MKIRFHKNFEKQYKKLTKKEKNKLRKRLEVFLKDQFHLLLNNHPLKGKYLSYRTINITGDLRAVYKLLNENEYIFVAIDSHSNLY